MPDYKYETILVDQDESVLTITLNRPERLNAVDRVMHRELEGSSARWPLIPVSAL